MKRYVYGGALVLVCGAISACNSDALLSPGETRALVAAERRWATRGFEDYAVEFRRLCFCDPIINQWARVEVVNGVVVRATLLSDGSQVPAASLPQYPTVEELFAQIRSGVPSDVYQDVVVEFDPVLGFPTRVSLVGKPTVADADVDNRLRNAGPISP